MEYLSQYLDWKKVLDWFMVNGIKILVVILITIIVLPIAKFIINRIFGSVLGSRLDSEMKKRADTLSSLVKNITQVVILSISLIIILKHLGIDIGPILAAAGIVGLAVGFGAQNLVKDIITGFFILLEDQVRVGDVVNINGEGGLVERVTLRITVLRDLAGNVHYIPNGAINSVMNMTKEFSYYIFDVGVAYRENTDEVIKLLLEVGEEIQSMDDYKNEILEPLEILGVDQFADSAVIIKARIKTKPIKQWFVGRQFNAMMKKKFDENNVEIPFPHVTLYMGEGKDGNAPPMNVVMQNAGKAKE